MSKKLEDLMTEVSECVGAVAERDGENGSAFFYDDHWKEFFDDTHKKLAALNDEEKVIVAKSALENVGDTSCGYLLGEARSYMELLGFEIAGPVFQIKKDGDVIAVSGEVSGNFDNDGCEDDDEDY